MNVTENKVDQGLLNFFSDSDVAKEFKTLKDPKQMINYMWKAPYFQAFNSTLTFFFNLSFKNFLKLNCEPSYGKSEGDSRRFRELGNKEFKVTEKKLSMLDYLETCQQTGKDVAAIKMFNKAIIKAPVNEDGKGKDASLAIANRSAALNKLGLYKNALEDVELALNFGYPKDLR